MTESSSADAADAGREGPQVGPGSAQPHRRRRPSARPAGSRPLGWPNDRAHPAEPAAILAGRSPHRGIPAHAGGLTPHRPDADEGPPPDHRLGGGFLPRARVPGGGGDAAIPDGHPQHPGASSGRDPDRHCPPAQGRNAPPHHLHAWRRLHQRTEPAALVDRRRADPAHRRHRHRPAVPARSREHLPRGLPLPHLGVPRGAADERRRRRRPRRRFRRRRTGHRAVLGACRRGAAHAIEDHRLLAVARRHRHQSGGAALREDRPHAVRSRSGARGVLVGGR